MESNRLKEYRQRYGLTQADVVGKVLKRARERGDAVIPGLDQTAVSKHENGHKHPGPYYRALYCEIYGATPAKLGFQVALPGEDGHPDDVDRREFLTGAVGFAASLALPVPIRLGSTDIVRLRESVIHLYALDDLHGAGAVYPATVQTFHRLRSFVEHASYDRVTGQALRELAGLTAEHAGWLAFDANRDNDARRWWVEAMQWGRRAESDSVSVVAMASMALQAADQHRPREVLDLATTAQSTAGRSATPRLTSDLLAREAVGHAGSGDATRAHAALRRARALADQPRHDDDPIWIDFYQQAEFASHECRAALALNDVAAAEDTARTALTLNDPAAYPRNHALYLSRLADVLAQRRKIDESAALATQATVAAAQMDSGRVIRGLLATAQRLAPFRDEFVVAEFLDRVAPLETKWKHLS